MHKSLTSRTRLIVIRWMDILAYSVCGAIVWTAVGAWITTVLRPTADLLGGLSPTSMMIIFATIAFVAWYIGGRNRLQGWIGFRHLFTYPPAWIAACAVPASLQIINPSRLDLLSTTDIRGDVSWFWLALPDWLRYGVALLSMLLVLWPFLIDGGHWIASLRTNKDRPPTSQAITQHEIETSGREVSPRLKQLLNWVRDDGEITSPDADRFGHVSIAERMADRLRETREAPTVALVGPQGSGKSSVRRLTAYALRHERRVRVVHISLWPFDSPEAAVRGILRALVNELGLHVGSTSLSGVSDDYVLAIEKSTGAYGGLARLLRGSADPEATVKRIADVACIVGLQLVLWVEDLERFSGGDYLDGNQQSEREIERLGPVRSLLHLLDKCPAVSVVVSDVSLRTRFDIGKLARFIERMPALKVEHTWIVLHELRSACLGGYPKRYIDPAAPEHRKKLSMPRSSHQMFAWLREYSSAPNLPEALCSVLQTPRSLKTTLRHTLEIWRTLCGEIDFDSLLVASALRVTRPDVFELIDTHIEAFRHGLTNPHFKETLTLHPAIARIDQLLTSGSSTQAVAIKTLISFLFPKYPSRGDVREEYTFANPQGLCNDVHADYWRRYLGQVEIAEIESDQAALNSIESWKTNADTDLVARLIDPNRSTQIRTFASCFTFDQLLQLLSDTVSTLATQSARSWQSRSRAPGIGELRQMISRAIVDEDRLFNSLHKTIYNVSMTHLPLAQDIIYEFSSSSSVKQQLLPDEDKDALQNVVRSVIATRCRDGDAVDWLISSLREGSPFTLLWMAWGIDRVRDDDLSGMPFADWPVVAKAMIELAERAPDIGVPACVPFILSDKVRVDLAPGPGGTPDVVRKRVYRVDPTKADGLFETDRLRRAIASFRVPATVEQEVADQLQAAIAWAREPVV